MNIRVQGVTQLCSGRRDQDLAKDRPHSPHFISVAQGPEMSKVRSLTELLGLRVSVGSYVAPKAPMQCQRCHRFGHTQRSCGYAPQCVAYGGSQLTGGCCTPREPPQCCGCGGKHTVERKMLLSFGDEDVVKALGLLWSSTTAKSRAARTSPQSRDRFFGCMTCERKSRLHGNGITFKEELITILEPFP